MKKLLLIFLPLVSFSQKDKTQVINAIGTKEALYGKIEKEIWGHAEVGYKEEKSSALLQKTLADADFKIEKGVADIPTAFTATFGSGKPVIGIMGEYDALPGLSQDSTSEKKAIGGVAGHACGHHLFGTASAAAAIEVKNWLVANKGKGTIRFYGCPAEEGGSGKVYMVRAGLFNDVDVALHWHPGASNNANASSSLANKSGKFRFYGVSAHAAGAPDKGRSALDGIEAMDHMVNMLREHVPQETRIHYVITNGGKAPNVVPDFAEVYYYARNPQRDVVFDVWDRIELAAKGAAMGTGTRFEVELTGGAYEVLPNETLAKVMHKNLSLVGGITYTPAETAFATKIAATLGSNIDITSAAQVQPYKNEGRSGGSTDVGDVSWAVPTVGMSTATWVPGTPAHSWQAVAAGGMSIGRKGMIAAAKTLAATAIDLFENQSIIDAAKAEFNKARGTNFNYKAMVGERKPALNYRD